VPSGEFTEEQVSAEREDQPILQAPRDRLSTRVARALPWLAAAALASCGGQSAVTTEAGVRVVPANPTKLASELKRNEAKLRATVGRWRARGADSGPPAGLTSAARYEQRAVLLLAHRPRLAGPAVAHLPDPLARTVGELSAALRLLDRLGAGEPSAKLRLGPPPPLADLLRYYHAGDRRFGVDWKVLAAVNMVESAFGRVRNSSSAGARGPMQFLPATWRAYGLGGDIEDPHDAILGAANYLAASGAPRDYLGALESYNPSALYAGAVLRIADAMRHDSDLVYALYAWRP
jgi:soluble lytic murein transglycosylase-like protein